MISCGTRFAAVAGIDSIAVLGLPPTWGGNDDARDLGNSGQNLSTHGRISIFYVHALRG
jgi:hypothetical protein